METIEQEIQRKGLNAPRITPADLEANIASEHFANGLDIMPNPDSFPELKRLTICICVLRNGFIVVGKSAAVSVKNYDAGIGMRAARADARNQMWPLMGYALREKMTTPDGVEI